jgi:AcrR family transcriptional regulator
MLLHYFGSKEALIGQVMEQVQSRLQLSFQELSRQTRRKGQPSLLRDFWRILSATQNRPALRLLFEVQMLALQNPKRYRRYLNRGSAAWRDLIQQALPKRQRNSATATLYAAMIDGLLLELLSTGDLRRTSAALARFAAICHPTAGPQKRKSR